MCVGCWRFMAVPVRVLKDASCSVNLPVVSVSQAELRGWDPTYRFTLPGIQREQPAPIAAEFNIPYPRPERRQREAGLPRVPQSSDAKVPRNAQIRGGHSLAIRTERRLAHGRPPMLK